MNEYLLSTSELPSNRQIAKMFGVDESTVRRRRRKLGLPSAPRVPSSATGHRTKQKAARPGTQHSQPAKGPNKNTANPPKLSVSGDVNTLDFDGLVSENPLNPEDVGAFAKIFQLANLDPAEFELVSDTFRFSTWQQSKALDNGERTTTQLYSYKGSFQRKGRLDLDPAEAAALLALATVTPRVPSAQPSQASPPRQPNHARIVIAGDFQAGKVDKLGGTEELLERLNTKVAALDTVLAQAPCAELYLFDPGDLTEGFENVASQKFLNDLSLPSMLRVGRAILTKLVTSIVAHGDTTVVAVPSNHGAWRSGKGYLGKPSDDFGLDVHHAVSEVFAQTKHKVSWVVPDEWDESVAVQIGAVKVGLVHGHQTKPGKFKDWWQGQALGSGPVADTHICISGHYHNTLLETCGFLDGRERYHIQSPPMDNGSSWWRNLTGEQSTPGIITFLLDKSTGAIQNFQVV